MKAEIISIGTELLLGHIVDTDAAFISRSLAGIGIDVYYHTTVGDNPTRLTGTIGQALGRNDIVITVGGLGPTVDDITMETVARLAGRGLIEDKAVLRDVHAHFGMRGMKTPRQTLRQALVPEGARIIRNKVGTAPGLILEYRGKLIVCLPGPPRELEPMLEKDVVPYLKRRFKSFGIIKSRTIKTTGLAESQVNGRVRDLLGIRPPTTVGIYARLGEVDLRIMAKAPSLREADRNIGRIERIIMRRLKGYIFGCDDDTLELAAGRVLLKKKKTLAIAESCTGGLLSSRITDVPGSSRYFVNGVICYSNGSKENLLGVKRPTLARYGAVSKEVALEMAMGIKHYSCADIGLAITGIAGPTGGTKAKPVGLVYIALVADRKKIIRQLRFKGSRQEIKFQASQAALELLRKHTA